MEGLLGKLELPGIELADTADSILLVDDGRGFSLCFGQHNVNEVLGRETRIVSENSDKLRATQCVIISMIFYLW